MTDPIHLPLRCASWLGCLALFALAGCGPDELQSPTAVKLKGIGNLYLDCALNVNNNTGPANEQDFKRYLRGLPDHVLSNNGMDSKSLDPAFVSGRDNEPFVVVYGIVITGISGKEAPVVAHEKLGKNGRFLVALANGQVRHVDQAGLEELKTPRKKDPEQ